jgi:imidazolonepropionase-like amidohydrolase
MPLLEAAFVLDTPIETQEVREAVSAAARQMKVTLIDVHLDIQEGPSGEVQFVQAELLCTPEEAHMWLMRVLIRLEGEEGYAEPVTVRIDGVEFQA